ncbi:MAG: hypothetical protein KAU31_02515 [Spirochaetaceae bacterium]|nr:hypothetical protein [Spirochaetaceae bacterium]
MITHELFLELGELMAFRHFYRHAYMMRLRWDRIQPLVKKLAYVPKAFAREIQDFLSAIPDSSSDDDSSVE